MRKKHIVSYGEYIKIFGKRMYVSVSGKGSDVILLLPGLGSVCPIIEMKALASYLINKYTVVSIEYLGYGMSDNASTERTIENIVNDIHEAMSILGFKKYSIAGHSIAGLYCLLYTNMYHDEVINFIGIDVSVPQQINMFEPVIDNMLKRKLSLSEKRLFFKSILTRCFARRFLKNINAYEYSNDNLSVYSELSVKALKHGSVINELQNSKRNFLQMQGAKFPDDVNVSLLIASDSEKNCPDWNKWHKEILNTSGKIEVLEGRHMLHLEKPELVAQKIDDFIANNSSDGVK